MNISVIADQQTEILQLATKIITDWGNKIQRQIKQQQPDLVLPAYTIFLTSNQNPSPKKSKPNLTIILEGTQLTSGQMLALSGQLSTFGQNQKPFVPTHVAQLTIANSIAMSTLQYYIQFLKLQSRENKKQVIEPKVHKLNCLDCLKYFGAFNVSAKSNGLSENKRGQNILQGGAPYYAIYPTKQGLLALGNLQAKFYVEMVQQMGLSQEDKQFCLDNQLNIEAWPKMRTIFANKLLQKSALEWQQIMKSRDTCITAVRNFEKISQHFLHPYLLKPKL